MLKKPLTILFVLFSLFWGRELCELPRQQVAFAQIETPQVETPYVKTLHASTFHVVKLGELYKDTAGVDQRHRFYRTKQPPSLDKESSQRILHRFIHSPEEKSVSLFQRHLRQFQKSVYVALQARASTSLFVIVRSIRGDLLTPLHYPSEKCPYCKP